MAEIGIMGGSFNPVHTGHLMVASYIRQRMGLDAVWLVVSPKNPLKERSAEVSAADRLKMVAMAVAPEVPRLAASNVEMTYMQPPYYTVDTLRMLRKLNPGCNFRLIIGSDNWLVFDRWREPEAIIREFGVIIYPRPGYPVFPEKLPEGVNLVEAPVVEISSTFVREGVARGMDLRWFVPDDVLAFIKERKFYR